MRGTRQPGAVRPQEHRFSPAHAGNTWSLSVQPNEGTVQPRACGEHTTSADHMCGPAGSAPRMRGTRCGRRVDFRRRRFSPAHAGNTHFARSNTHFTAVQPRACGEHPSGAGSIRYDDGSAPRMRGTQLGERGALGDRRFIPAHAGNTTSKRSSKRPRSVHPRACGEHAMRSTNTMSSDGSAPRMRGTRLDRRSRHALPRFSPAHAGNTSPSAGGTAGRSVQPRACGEHLTSAMPIGASAGSAPRMRGTRKRARDRVRDRRFSPAHAGNTGRRRRRAPSRSVQPRACGEHLRARRWVALFTGSAPRMRGTRRRRAHHPRRLRFSPAHAGNTRVASASASRSKVQPRACGEHSMPRDADVRGDGSAPRMRGTRKRRDRLAPRQRFSPAHAGNTRARIRSRRPRAVQPRACGEHCRSSSQRL